MKLITKVREVKQVSNIDELDKLVKEDWILLSALSSPEGILFILGRLNLD
ncbi:MAG: hypothetical protein ACM3TR_10920 [Caulobacteraceae bacterium]